MTNKEITKQELVEIIKEWLSYDKEIKELQKEIKEKKKNQKNLTDNLISIMKNNEIDCFDINNGKLLYKTSKVKSGLNKNTLLESIQKYFINDDSVNPSEITNFILDNRTIKTKDTIKCKYDKN